ncbi:MAG TPA: hypothetical protein VIT44_08630 [Cyclobacteriaceae bacterium]
MKSNTTLSVTRKMMLLVILAAIALCKNSEVLAQDKDIRLNLYGGYVFDDKFDSYYDNSNFYDGKIVGGFQWGGGIEYMLRPEYGIEILYLRQDTHAPTTYATGSTGPVNIKETDFDLAMNYIMLGGARHVVASDGKVEGFGGLMAGMAIAELKDPVTGREASAEKFAWGLRLGGIFWASEKAGIKLQAQLVSAVQSMGGGFYFGTGGAGVGVGSYSTIYQFTLGGGLVFKLGGNK